MEGTFENYRFTMVEDEALTFVYNPVLIKCQRRYKKSLRMQKPKSLLELKVSQTMKRRNKILGREGMLSQVVGL